MNCTKYSCADVRYIHEMRFGFVRCVGVNLARVAIFSGFYIFQRTAT